MAGSLHVEQSAPEVTQMSHDCRRNRSGHDSPAAHTRLEPRPRRILPTKWEFHGLFILSIPVRTVWPMAGGRPCSRRGSTNSVGLIALASFWSHVLHPLEPHYRGTGVPPVEPLYAAVSGRTRPHL